jgi:hypothetical protein
MKWQLFSAANPGLFSIDRFQSFDWVDCFLSCLWSITKPGVTTLHTAVRRVRRLLYHFSDGIGSGQVSLPAYPSVKVLYSCTTLQLMTALNWGSRRRIRQRFALPHPYAAPPPPHTRAESNRFASAVKTLPNCDLRQLQGAAIAGLCMHYMYAR